MHNSRRIFAITALAYVVLAFVGAAVMLIIRPPVMVADVTTLHLRTAAALVITLTSIGGAGLFAAGIKTFRLKLRVAYRLVAVGIGLFGLALAQLPITAFFDLWNMWWVKSGMIILPFVVATTLLYVGIRQFARLLDIKNKLTDYRITSALTLGFSALSFVLGHYVVHDHAVAGTDFYTAVVGWSAINLSYAALLAHGIRRQIGAAYQPATRWLAIALAAMAVSAWHEYTINFFMNTGSWYVAHGLSLIPFILGGLLIIRAGYAFCLLGIVSVTPFIPVAEAPSPLTDDDYFNSITTLAALASRREAIDPVLDTLRVITANLPPGQLLNDAAKKQLVSTYQSIEAYLIYNDPLRNFNRDDLRSRLRPAFRAVLEQANW